MHLSLYIVFSDFTSKGQCNAQGSDRQFMSHHQQQDWNNSLCDINNPPFPLVTIVVFSFVHWYLALVGEGSIQYISTLCNTSQKISHCNWHYTCDWHCQTLMTDNIKHLWLTLSNTYDWQHQTLVTDIVKHLWLTLSNTYDWHCWTLMTDTVEQILADCMASPTDRWWKKWRRWRWWGGGREAGCTTECCVSAAAPRTGAPTSATSTPWPPQCWQQQKYMVNKEVDNCIQKQSLPQYSTLI